MAPLGSFRWMNGSSVFGPRVTVARRRVSAKKLRRKRDSQRNEKIEERRGGGERGRSRAGKKLIGPSGSAIASVNQARYVPGSVSSLSYGQRGVRLISTRPSFSPLSSGPPYFLPQFADLFQTAKNSGEMVERGN